MNNRIGGVSHLLLGYEDNFRSLSASFTVTSAAESIIVSSALTRVSDTLRHGYMILSAKGI